MGAPIRPVNRIAQGLLGFFGLKSLGRNPDELVGTLQPVVETADWFLRTNAEQITRFNVYTSVSVQPFSTPFNAWQTPLVIPNDEWWYIHAATLIAVLPAGAVTASEISEAMLTSVRNSQPGQYHEQLVANRTGTTNLGPAVTPDLVVADFSRPRAWFPPGTIFGCGWEKLSLATIDAGAAARINGHYSITRAPA
jgi:hypothetical protein